MSNPYDPEYGTFDGPCATGFAITPHDSTDFTLNAKCIFVGVGGTVVLVTPGGVTLTFKNVASGSVLPWAAKRINSTGTTATDMIGGR